MLLKGARLVPRRERPARRSDRSTALAALGSWFNRWRRSQARDHLRIFCRTIEAAHDSRCSRRRAEKDKSSEARLRSAAGPALRPRNSNSSKVATAMTAAIVAMPPSIVASIQIIAAATALLFEASKSRFIGHKPRLSHVRARPELPRGDVPARATAARRYRRTVPHKRGRLRD